MNKIQTKNKTIRALLLVVFALMLAVCGASFFGATQNVGTQTEQQAVYAAYNGGTGTEEDPYKISTAAHLVEFAGNVNGGTNYSNKYFVLTAEIDLSGKVWTPIGDKASSRPFSGIFDGNGYKIKGLTINMSLAVKQYGLFGYIKGTSLTNQAIIRNVTLESVNINGSADYAGAVVAYAGSYSKIEDCSSKGNIGSTTIGGIAGYIASNVTVSGCYSSATVKSNKTIVGGIVGQTASSATTIIKKCFFTGSVSGGASSTKGGIVGSLGSNAKVSDVYSDSGYKGGTSTTTVVTDSSNWIKDVKGTNDAYLMNYSTTVNGSQGYVLKGVGNIVVSYKTYEFKNGAYSTTPTDNQEALIYSITSGYYAASATANSKLDNDCHLASVEGKDSSNYKDVNYTFTKIKLTRTNGAASNTMFKSNSGEKEIYPTSNLNSYNKGAYIKFSVASSWGNPTHTVSSSSNYHTIKFGNSVAGYYRIDALIRGVWRKTVTTPVVYSSSDKTTAAPTTKIKTTIALAKDTLKVGIDDTAAAVTTLWSNNHKTSSPASGYTTFYVPHGETYTITFANNVSGYDYLSNMQSFATGNQTSSNPSSITAAKRATAMKTAIGTAGTAPIVELLKTKVKTSVAITSNNTLHTYYFDNAQKINLGLNFDAEDKCALNNADIGEVSNNKPFLMGKNSVNGNGSITLYALINETLGSKGIAYEDGSSLKKISGTGIKISDAIYPMWSKFTAASIKTGSTSGTAWLTNSNGFGGELKFSASTFNPTSANRDSNSVCNWFVHWAGTEETIAINNMFVADGVKDANGNSITAEAKDYVASNKIEILKWSATKTGDGTEKKNATNTATITSIQKAYFYVQPQGGYYLSAIYIGPAYGDSVKIEIAERNQTYPINTNFRYAGNEEVLSLGDDFKVEMHAQISFSDSTNIYTVALSGAIGLSYVNFEYRPKTFYGSEIKTSIDADIKADKSPLKATVVRGGKTELSAVAINKTGTEVLLRFREIHSFTITDIATGYYLDNNIVDAESFRSFLKVNVKAPSGVSSDKVTWLITNFKRTVKDGKIASISFDFQITYADPTIDSISLVLDVKKAKTTFNLNVTGANFDYGTFTLGYKIYELDGSGNFKERQKSSAVGSGTTLNINNLSVYTGEKLELYVQYPAWASVSTKTFANLDKNTTMTEVNGVSEYNISLTNFAHTDGTVVNVNFGMLVKTTNIAISQEIDGTPIKVIDTFSIKYGTIISANDNKDSGVITLTVYDPHADTTVSHTFNYDIKLIDEAKSKILLGESGKTGLDFSIDSFSKTLASDDNSNKWFGLNGDPIDIALTISLTSSTAQVYIGYVKVAIGVSKISGAKVTKNEVTQGSDITETATPPTGYEFVGWSLHSYSTSTQSPEGSNYNTTYKTAEIKLCLNVSKTGRVNLVYSPYIYIIAVYRAKLYQISFETTVTDGPSKKALSTTLSYPGKTPVQIEFGKTYPKAAYSTLLPTATIAGMYDFAGWDSTINGSNTISYQNKVWSTAEFKLNEGANLNEATNFVTFSIIYNPKTIKINLFVDENDTGKDGTVVYGSNVYNMGGYVPSKKAYNFVGWEYSGTKYVEVSGSSKIYDIPYEEVRFDAKFEEKNISLVISAGTNGQKFPNGNTTITGGYIRVGQNNITSDIFDKDFKLTAVPTWTSTFATFEFRGFIFVNSDNVIIPKGYENNCLTSGKTSYEFKPEDIDDGTANPVVTIYAFYEMVDITDPVAGADSTDAMWSISGTNCTVTYDGLNHNLKITEDSKASGIVKYSYAWKKGDTTVSSRNSAAIKTVSNSGTYKCVVTATTNVFNAMGKITEDSNDINVTVNKKKLDVTQNNKVVNSSNPIVKTYDNTLKLEAEDNISFNGKCGSDNVVLDITFPSVNVGTNYQLVPELSGKDKDNYYVDTATLKGNVIKYVLHLELKDAGEDFVYKVGADNKKVNIKDKYQLIETDTAFLTKNGFSFDFTIKTNKNIIGQYTHNGASNKFIYTITVGAAGAQSSNFDIQAVPFRIIDKDANSLVVNIMVVTNDYPGETDKVLTSDIATITATGLPESSTGNGTSEIIVIETKDYFNANKDIPLALKVQSAYASYYRVEKWKVLLDSSEQSNAFGTNATITYTVANTAVKEITIRVYITRLKTITLNYNVVNKTEITQGYIDDLKTVIALGETINTSKSTYNSNFPLVVTRPGWKFNGWKVNNTVVTSSTIWTFQGTTLVASWSIDNIVVDAQEKSIQAVYSGESLSETFTIKNLNTTSLTYSYAWSTTATTAGSYSNATLTVKDFKNSGTYTLTITATDGSLSATKVCKVVVNIQKYQLFAANFSIDKEYDADSSAVYIAKGVKSEIITISGSYFGAAAGSKLNKNTLSYKGKIDKTDIEVDINNYSIDAKYISEDSKINVKAIKFSPENQSKSYSRTDKTPLVYPGTYNVGKIKFSYQISTPSAEVGEYKDDELIVTIISGDVESNFDFTVSSTFTIGKEKLNNSNVSWKGDTKVTFDGKSHKLELQSELEDIVAKYVYTNAKGEILGSQYAVYAGTYTVTVVVVTGEINYEIEETLKTTLVIEKRTISVSYEGAKYTRAYDGTIKIPALAATVTGADDIESAYKPVIRYDFKNSLAGINKDIVASLASANANLNESYIISQAEIVGDITKIKTDITVNAKKVYDGKSDFVVTATATQISATNLLKLEGLSGAITFKVKDAGTYTNSANLEFKNELNIGAHLYSVNYEINSVTYNIVIEKAEVRVLVTDAINEYEYTGEEVKITYTVTRIKQAVGAETPKELMFTYHADTSKDATTVLDIDKAVQVGTYTYELLLIGKDADNFKISSDSENVGAFTIKRRDITVYFSKTIPYDPVNGVVYSSDDYPTDTILHTTSTLGVGDNITWEMIPSGKEVRAYLLTVEDDFSKIEINIYKNNIDYKRNYRITTNSLSTVNIGKRKVDFSQLVFEGLTSTYSASTQEVVIKIAGQSEPFDYTRIIRKNGAGEASLPTAADIYYAGTYTLEFSMRNYTVENLRPIVKNIAPYEVDIMPVAGTVTKEYDGNINVLEEFIELNPSKKFFAADDGKISVIGTYDTPKAAKNKPITYSLTNSYVEVFYSYKLLTTAGTGEITPANIYLALDQKHQVYYTGENVKIEASVFGNYNKINPTTGLFEKTFVGNETLTGTITLNQTNAGTYPLSEYTDSISMVLQVITLGTPSDSSNYSIHFATNVNTTVVIRKAEVQIDIKDTNKIYNALVQEPLYETVIYDISGNPRGKLIESEFNSIITYTYKVSGTATVVDPINAGNYDITISVPDDSNYILVKDAAGTTTASYSVTGGPLRIAKRKIAVNVPTVIDRIIKLTIKNGEIEYPKDWVAEYQVVSKTDVFDPTGGQNGLIPGHIFSATLKTSKGDAGYYTINPSISIDGEVVGTIVKPNNNEFSVKNNGVELRDNYEVISYSAVIRVYAVSDFDASELEDLVYDATDKVASEKIKVYLIVDNKVFPYTYGKDNVFSDLKLNGVATNQVKLAGNYSFVVSAEPVPGHVQTKTIEFDVAQKVITNVSLTTNKQYDATANIIGSITSTDICAGDVVSISAFYTNGVENVSTVGVHKVKFELAGTAAPNYNISDLVITGEIKQRAITISLDSSVTTQTFTNNTFTIDYTKVNVNTPTTLVAGQTLSGSVLLTKINFGEYVFNLENANLDNLKIRIQNSGVDVTSNYKLTLTGKYNVVAKLIELDVSAIDFTYDAEIQKIDENLTIANPTADEAFNTLAMQNVNIAYNKEVVDAGNYVATISSKTTNFEYKVNGYTNNQIPFVVKQRVIKINVGTVEYSYNPTSAYVTNLKNEHIDNILSKHSVTGTYKLNQIGLGVGTYTANSDGTGPIVFNVGIYVNGANLIGTNYKIDEYAGTIKITPFEVSEFYLVNNSFVYSKTDAKGLLEVAFVDANNKTQIITAADGTWGKFTVNQGATKNVDAIDVGSYFVEVEIYNCVVAVNTLDFEITKFTITDIAFNPIKQYDGTSVVINSLGQTNLTSDQIFTGDTLKITATYRDSNTGFEATNVGTYTIVFAIDQTVGDYRNYQVLMTAEGSIVKRIVALELIDKEFTYRPDGIYVVEFDKDNRAFTSTTYAKLVEGNYLLGSISITKTDYIGTLDNTMFNLSNLTVYDKENKEQTSNYSFVVAGENKTIKAKVAVYFGSQTQFEYTAKPVAFDPVLSFTNADPDVTADDSLVTFRYISASYDSAEKPVRVGAYLLTLTLVSNCYVFEVADGGEFKFNIYTHKYIVTPDQIPTTQKVYGDADPVLDFKITTDLDEIVDISLTRDPGENFGEYDVHLDSWKNNNYVIEFAENTGVDAFVITQATLLNIAIKDTEKTRNKLTKIYDTSVAPKIAITEVDYVATYRGEVITTEILSGDIYFEAGVNVGFYKLTTWEIKSLNFKNFSLTSEVDYGITPKEIQVTCDNGTKPFDNSKKFLGTINILDKEGNPVSIASYPLVISGEYTQAEVGESIKITLSYTGDSISNYKLEKDYLTGTIRKRNVNVIPENDQYSIYERTATSFDIQYQITDGETGYEFFGELIDFVAGNLYINKPGDKYVAGVYNILNGLNADYFEIAFTSGVKYTIQQKELTVTNSENFEKIYDGKTEVIGTFDIEGVELGDIVEISATFYDKDITAPSIDVSDNKVVVFTLTGADAANYFVQNVAGAIKPKEVKLNFSYVPSTYTMHNADRIENNKENSVILTYLQKVSYKVMALPTPTHEGYEFGGWFLDEAYTIPITLDTVISDAAGIWGIDENEKTAYAKWTILEFFVELIEATRVNGVYKTGSTYPGGTVNKSFNGKYEYWSEFDLAGLATANEGYIFNCYSDDLTGAPTEAIQDNKLRVYAKENYVYARFDPVEITLVLKANEGVFTQVAKWDFSSDFTTATLVVEYNQTLVDVGTTLPTVTRRGYTHDTSKWLDTDGNEYPITDTTLIAADYYPQKELKAVWIANTYNLTVNANEGYFATYDTAIWTVKETNADSQVIKLTKTVTYDQAVGILVDPYRKGWGFGGYEGMTEEYVWDYIIDVEISAIWLEQEFELKINSPRGNVDVVILNNKDTVIDNYVLNTAETTNIKIKVKTTNKAVIIVTQNVGYEFTNWTTDVDNIADLTTTQIEINQFLESQEITAVFTPRINKITLVINNTARGTLKGTLSSDTNTTVTTTDTVDTVEIFAATEDQIMLLVTPFEGYKVGSWEVESQEKFGLAGGIYDAERLLFDFVWDLTVIVNVVPQDIAITIISTIEKGAISIEDAIEGVESYTHSVPTESPLIFRITVNHGYHVVTDLASWAYETASVNKGAFVVELETEGVYKITFTGFTANGTIRVPFERNTYTITFVNVYFDESYEIDRAAKEIVSVTRGENTILLNSNDSFDDLYLNEARLTPVYVKEGYTFKYWSTEGNKTLPIIPSEGLVDIYEDGSIDIQVLDNLTLYLIYVINEYTITYSTNDADKGVLAYNNDESEGRDQFAVVLKYGRTTKPVTAMPNGTNNFVFSHWVIVDSEGNETEYSKSKEIIIDAVTQDLTFKAIFRGNEITITINVTLPESELIGNFTDLDKEELYFSEITFDGTVGTPSFNKDGLVQSWTFKTYAGENVGFTFTEKNGYVFAYCNPYLNMEAPVAGSQGPIPFTTSTLYYSASYDISMKARTNTVLIKIINNKGTDPKGANIFEDHNNSIGIEDVQIVGDQKALEYQVKTGGSIQAFLNIYEGYVFDYMSVSAYFNEPTQAVDSDMYISTGEIKNISSDMEILLYVRPYVYEVTFEYNYDGCPVSVVSQVEIGEVLFNPALPEQIFGPTRPKYNFIAWSMDSKYQTETSYEFDNGQIYRYEYVDYNAVKVYGFNGTTNAVASTKAGVDFECTLYAYWELIKHKVDVVFVPTTALQNPNINYTQMFPNTEGRYLRFADDFTQRVEGISYVPEVLVEIVAPACFEGYEYYGWSYDNEITNKAKINVGNYSQIMIEEDIVVYLYYTLEVKVVSNGHGTVTPESAKVLYNGTITLDGKPDAAYLFDRWVLNGNVIPNSKQKMDLTITEPSNIEAVYLGEEINIILEQVTGGTVKFLGTNNTDQAIYRVGDTVMFEIADIKYGYFNKEWVGEFEGVVINNEYVVSPNDAIKKYAKFKMTIAPQNMSVSFVVDGGIGGQFIVDGESTIFVTKTYLYDSPLSFETTMEDRFEIISLTVNGTAINTETKGLTVNKENNFLVNITNEIKLTFRQMLWTDIYEMFNGFGTEKDPYVITNEQQLAAMAYLINNGVDSEGKIPYARGYYILKKNMDLNARFWQPIGTKENPFGGTFNFAECVVSNIILDRFYEVTSYDGLFGVCSADADFLTVPPDMGATLIIIIAVASVVAVAGIGLGIYLTRRRKRVRRLSNQSQIAMNKLQAQNQADMATQEAPEQEAPSEKDTQ